MGLEEQVHCVGFLSDIETVLPHLDFLVHPARTEGLGVALLQAASAGLAVIASRAGGMPEAVLDEETGSIDSAGRCASAGGGHGAILKRSGASRSVWRSRPAQNG